MPILRGPFWLRPDLVFPPTEAANDDGLLALGGDLSIERLLLAYSQGIFPWYDERSPILWWAPDPRFVLLPAELHVSRSLRQTLNRRPFRLTMDTAFERVIAHCGKVPREGQGGTWITSEMLDAYIALHHAGFAHSIEAWQGDELVGGLYGVSLGRAFFGESMFHLVPDASKVTFVSFVRQLERWGFEVVDCQIPTEHLRRFGAREIPRAQFNRQLDEAFRGPTLRGRWSFDGEVGEAS